MVDRAEAGAGDDEEREFPAEGKVGDGEPPLERHEEAADALDEEDVIPPRHLLERRVERRKVQRPPLLSRGNGRCERRPVADRVDELRRIERAERAFEQHRIGRHEAVIGLHAAARHGLHHSGVHSAPPEARG